MPFTGEFYPGGTLGRRLLVRVKDLMHGAADMPVVSEAVPATAAILEITAKKLGMEPEKMVVTVDQHGNTSAASIPLALVAAVRDGRVKKGDVVMMEGVGGGFTWGAVLARM